MSKAIVFDMDGVLFDTERLCMRSWLVVADRWGIPDMEIVFPQCIGRNSNDSMAIVYEQYGTDFPYAEFRREASKWFWETIERDGLPMKEGVREILEYLREQRYIIGLASSTKRESVEKCLQKAGIREFFTEVITGDMVVHSKPRPDIYLIACERLGVSPGETYAVEDSTNGILSAKAAGMKVIMVPDMLEPDEETKKLCVKVSGGLPEAKQWLAEQEEGKTE